MIYIIMSKKNRNEKEIANAHEFEKVEEGYTNCKKIISIRHFVGMKTDDVMLR